MQRAARRTATGVTIADVARTAGVSAMTVSRVMRGDRNVTEPTRLVVLKAIRELNYVPNMAARTLAGADHLTIGVIYGNPSAAYLSEFLVGVLDESAGRGAALSLVKCEAPEEEAERAAVERLVQSGVTGVVLPPPLGEASFVVQALKRAEIATVAVATGGAASDASCIRIDDRAAAAEMTRYLIALGHRRIGFIMGHPNQTASHERLAGFRRIIDSASGAEAVVAQGYFTFASGLEAAESLLAGQPRPTAIFASNDDMAAAAVSVAHRRGLDVPRDLTVVGFDDTQLAVTVWPPLTTIRQPVRAMAQGAVDLLIREIGAARAGAPLPPVDQVIAHELIVRQSSDRPPP
jgi:LacI family transcriptional regulator